MPKQPTDHTTEAHLAQGFNATRRRFIGRAVQGAALVPLAASANTLGAAGNSSGPGIAVPIGGALRYDNHEVWARLVELAGGPGGRFAVFATAAGNPERSAGQIMQALRRHGAEPVHIAAAPGLRGVDVAAAVQDERWITTVLGCRGVFFAGGAQERITATLQPGGQPTPLLNAVWSVFNAGGVVAGTSAGAAVMSRLMFRDAQSVMKVLKGQLTDGRETDRGLGFVGPDLFIDQHFLKRGRIGRMLPLMTARGYQLGLGVEENSAAIVRGDQIEVIGARGALLADLRQATHSRQGPVWELQGALLSFLDRGDRYDVTRRSLQPSAAKAAEPVIDAKAPGFKPYFNDRPFHLDILGDNTIANAMAHLIDNTATEVLGLAADVMPAADDPAPDLAFEFRLHKRPESRGWFSGALGGEDYSVAHLGLDVRPVRVSRPLYTPWRR